MLFFCDHWHFYNYGFIEISLKIIDICKKSKKKNFVNHLKKNSNNYL